MSRKILFLTKCLSECPSSMKPPLLLKISGCMPALRHYSFCKMLHDVPFSRYSSFCILNYPMFFQICDMMSISTWDMLHFSIYLLNHNSLRHQTWWIDRWRQGQYFFEIFWAIQKTGAKFQALSNLATCSNYSRTNCVSSAIFLKGWIRDNWK